MQIVSSNIGKYWQFLIFCYYFTNINSLETSCVNMKSSGNISRIALGTMQ